MENNKIYDYFVISALQPEVIGLDIDNLGISGVGKVNATIKALEIIHNHQPKLIINYGTVGAVAEDVDGLVDCTKFCQMDMDATPLDFKIGQTPFENEKKVPRIIDTNKISDGYKLFNPIGKNLLCGTSDKFVVDKPSMRVDVVDMEAYAIAKVCHICDVKFISFKYISDRANSDSPREWVDHCSDGVKKFKEILEHYDNI